MDLAIRPEDQNFFNLWQRTGEYRPEHPRYQDSLLWNLGAVDRGARYVAAVARYLALQGRRVLDVGCGSGGVCIAFARAGARCTGIEPADHRLAWAVQRTRDHGVEVDLRRATIETVDFAPGSFDVILATDVLEHLEDYRRAVGRICELLAAGGLFLATVPNPFHWRNLVSDPHSNLFGVLLLPRPWRAFYVVRLRRSANAYLVHRLPACHRLAAICRGHGCELLEPAALAKLEHPGAAAPLKLRLPAFLHRAAALRAPIQILVSMAALPSAYRLIARKQDRIGQRG
jgi:2-polyprenyl-6-hydroxyphenyl methylase/3-demethylubiquinone-9 3-methyltransferase